jgi:hypothetical protein
MSLKRADWKAVLDQPKNAGMKAFGGTGIGKTLDDYERADAAFRGAKTVANGDTLEHALKAVQTQCEAVIKKHKAVYTAACKYLEGVKQLAGTELAEVIKELTALREEAYEKHRKEHMRSVVKELCTEAKSGVQNAGDSGGVAAVWQHFVPRFEVAAGEMPNMKAFVNRVKEFKPAVNPNTAIQGIKKQYVDLVTAVENAVR